MALATFQVLCRVLWLMVPYLTAEIENIYIITESGNLEHINKIISNKIFYIYLISK